MCFLTPFTCVGLWGFGYVLANALAHSGVIEFANRLSFPSLVV